MSRSSSARVARRIAKRSAPPHGVASAPRWHIAPAYLPRVPAWARFGEQAGAEHEAAHAAISDALAARGPAPDLGAVVVVGVDLGNRVLVSFEPLEEFAAKIQRAGHADVASAIRRPVQSGMVRTLAVSRCESFQAGAAFWPDKPINTCTRGTA
ncbi:hypothetical protein [Sorangium sp. So ce1000]|uniref:hypothetical protein n=1 Tax=Sorangium sp. So ce1000 TaxID=3133325 RepID=UPI003F5E329A